jgi:hypothetical protein
MATKAEELANPNGCLNKAADDEPIFVLRGQDLHADFGVDQWATAAALMLGDYHWKVIEARQIAQQMRDYPKRKMPD